MRIRAYKEGDEKEIWSLDRRLETHPWNRRDLNNWYWKYTAQNPSGKSYIWLLEDSDKIIAHFAAVPYKVKVFDEELIASHSVGALVEKKYQRKGLLKFIGDKLFEDLTRNNIPFTYGFPNSISYGLHKTHMGYTDLIAFDTWKIQKAEINKIPNENIDYLTFKGIKEFDDTVNELWKTCSADYEITVVRDKDYLNWRYLARPDWEYYPFGIYRGNILKGYIVLKLYKENKILRGHIIDVFAHRNDRDTLKKAIEGSINFFIEQDVKEITCWLWGSNLFEEIIEERGFMKIKTSIPLVIRVNKEFKYMNEVKDKRHWYFTMGDSTEIF